MATHAEDTSTVGLGPHERRWQDLRTGQLCLGLTLGPIAMTFVFALIAALDAEISLKEFSIGALVLLFGSILWSLGGGWAYLLSVVRLRGRIERAECLLVGVALSDLLPAGFLLLSYAIAGRAGVAGMFGGMDGTSLLIVGSMLSMLGLVGGCLFWLFGVRPSKGPDLVSVFD
jgi:hypothetical protein